MTETKKTASIKKVVEKTHSKQAILQGLKGMDKRIASVILDDTPQTMKQATDKIETWKKREVNR